MRFLRRNDVGNGVPGESADAARVWDATAPPGPAATPKFIGRAAEQQDFRDLVDALSRKHLSSAFIHVSGPVDSGRRALLRQFHALCAQGDSPRATPVIELVEAAGSELDELLERIATGLEPEPRKFKRFFDSLQGFRARQRGQPSTISQVVTATRAGLAVAEDIGVPGMRTAGAAAQPLGDVAIERGEAARSLETVREEFVRGLLELAADKAGPVVLLLADVDLARTDPKVLWIRRSLLPRVAQAPVLVAVTSEPQFELGDVAVHFGHVAHMRLGRFSQDEAEEFLEQNIGLAPGTPLGRAVLEDSDRFPDRLGRYTQYFREHPEALDRDELPPEARDLTAGGAAFELLSRVRDPMRRVILHAAPLRWFNAELLDGVAHACGLADESRDVRASALLDRENRPSWVTNLRGGWGVDLAHRRRAMVKEFRRLHPILYRGVHLHAARYHLARMRELEGAPGDGAAGEALDEATVFGYQPTAHPQDRLKSDEYVMALSEWLYHLVALSPAPGFVRLADHAAEALAWDLPVRAEELLDIGTEITLPPAESLTRQRLADIARALHHERHAEALQLLDDFGAGGSSSAIADAVASFVCGSMLWNLGRSPADALERLERAKAILGTPGNDVQAGFILALVLTWIALLRSRLDGNADAALPLLVEAEHLEGLDVRMQAEIKRARGVVLSAFDFERAAADYDEALGLLQRRGATEDVAMVLRNRAELNLERGEREAAERDLLRARSIYQQLFIPSEEAEVLVDLIGVALGAGDQAAAAELGQRAVTLRPTDFLLRTKIGNAYHNAGLYEESVRWHSEGIAISSEAVLFRNRGLARQGQARQAEDPSDGEGLDRLALADMAEACRRAPDDLDAGVELAELQRKLGQESDAAESARRVAPLIVDAALGHVGTAEPESPGELRRLRGLLVRTIPLLDAASAVDVLERWCSHMPDDQELQLARAVAWPEVSYAGDESLERAIEAARRAVGPEDDPSGRALVVLADLYARKKDWVLAEEAARQAAELGDVGRQAEDVRDRLEQLQRQDDDFGDEADVLLAPLAINIADDLRSWFDPAEPAGSEFFAWMIDAFRAARESRLGIDLPGVRVRIRRGLPRHTFQILVDEVPRSSQTMAADLLAGASPDECRARAGVDGEPASLPWSDGPGTWLPSTCEDAVRRAGIPFWDVRRVALAVLDQVLDEHPWFMGAEYAGSLAGLDWWLVPEDELLEVAGVVRPLVAAHVPPDRFPHIVQAYMEADGAARPDVIREAARAFGVPRTEPAELAAAFESTRFLPPDPDDGRGSTATATVAVLVAPSWFDRHGGELRRAARQVVDELSDSLDLPSVEVRVRPDSAVSAGGAVVAVGDTVRYACSAPVDEVEWWALHPQSGATGRTGIAAAGPAAWLVRALEEVLWDDPGLLLPDTPSVQRALEEKLEFAPDERLATAFGEVLGRRAPLGPVAKIARACERVRDGGHLPRLRLPAARRFSSTPGRPIPDALAFGIRDVIHVDEPGRIRQLAVRVDLQHRMPFDLVVSLTSPEGLRVVLHSHGDDLGVLRAGLDAERLPALAGFLDQHATGEWTLHVQDLSSIEGGMLDEWALELRTSESSGEPTRPARAPSHLQLPDDQHDALILRNTLERDLFPRNVTAAVGARLWEALEAEDPGGRLHEQRSRLERRLAHALGVHLRYALNFVMASDLPDWGFRVLVNGLPRATGELPPGRFGHADAGAPDASGDVWVHPEDRSVLARLPDEADRGFDSPDRLMSHVHACIQEAALEFTDRDWTRSVLSRLEMVFPKTVTALRGAWDEDVLTSVLRRLVADGVSVGDPRLLEAATALAVSPRNASALKALELGPRGYVDRIPRAAAEWLRQELDRGAAAVDLPLIELGPAIEDGLRAAIEGGGNRIPAYSFARAGEVLTELEETRRTLGTPWFAVVTTAPLRHHVQRLIGAQFPAAPVLVREEAPPEAQRLRIDIRPD